MAEVTMDLDGVGTMLNNIGAFELETRGKVIHAVEAVTISVQDDAKLPVGAGGNMPVDTHTLQRSISRRFKNGGLTGEVFTNVEYALRQEFGFSGTDALGRTYDQKGSLFMTKALEANRAKLIRDIKRILR